MAFRFATLAANYEARFAGLQVDKEAELLRYREFAERIRPMVIETISFLHRELQGGKKVLVEGANAAMLDIDFGNHSLTSPLFLTYAMDGQPLGRRWGVSSEVAF